MMRHHTIIYAAGLHGMAYTISYMDLGIRVLDTCTSRKKNLLGSCITHPEQLGDQHMACPTLPRVVPPNL